MSPPPRTLDVDTRATPPPRALDVDTRASSRAPKSGGELTSVAAVVPDVPYLKLAPGPHAPSVAAGAQQPFAWTGDCVAPFAEAPEVRLTFVAAADGVPHRYAMRLPVIASCFCEVRAAVVFHYFTLHSAAPLLLLRGARRPD